MPFISNQSLDRLNDTIETQKAEIVFLKERNHKLGNKYHELEKRHQEILLQLGIVGYQPEVKPAVPERVVLKKLRT
jgi:hypothetical protein